MNLGTYASMSLWIPFFMGLAALSLSVIAIALIVIAVQLVSISRQLSK